VPLGEVTEGPTKGPLDEILAKLVARVMSAREVEAAAEQVEEIAGCGIGSRRCCSLRQEARGLRKAEEKSAEKRLNGEGSNRRGILTDNLIDDIKLLK